MTLSNIFFIKIKHRDFASLTKTYTVWSRESKQ